MERGEEKRAAKATLVCSPRSGCPINKEVSWAQSPSSLPSGSLTDICHGHCSPLGSFPGAPGAPGAPLQPRQPRELRARSPVGGSSESGESGEDRSF